MLTYKDLKEYDIKNIDVKKLLGSLTQRQDYLIDAALIVVAIFFGIKIMADQKGKAAHLTQQVSVLEQKTAAISEFEAAKSSVENYVATLPQGLLETNTIIERLNSLALARQVQILSYEPDNRQATDMYIKTKFKLTLFAKEYKDIGLFIQDVENSEHNFRIEQWSVSRDERELKSDEGIRVFTVVSSIYFKK